jgi:hypothetical protein
VVKQTRAMLLLGSIASVAPSVSAQDKGDGKRMYEAYCNRRVSLARSSQLVRCTYLTVTASCDPETDLTPILPKPFSGSPLLRSS